MNICIICMIIVFVPTVSPLYLMYPLCEIAQASVNFFLPRICYFNQTLQDRLCSGGVRISRADLKGQKYTPQNHEKCKL